MAITLEYRGEWKDEKNKFGSTSKGPVNVLNVTIRSARSRLSCKERRSSSFSRFSKGRWWRPGTNLLTSNTGFGDQVHLSYSTRGRTNAPYSWIKTDLERSGKKRLVNKGHSFDQKLVGLGHECLPIRKELLGTRVRPIPTLFPTDILHKQRLSFPLQSIPNVQCPCKVATVPVDRCFDPKTPRSMQIDTVHKVFTGPIKDKVHISQPFSSRSSRHVYSGSMSLLTIIILEIKINPTSGRAKWSCTFVVVIGLALKTAILAAWIRTYMAIKEEGKGFCFNRYVIY